MILCCLFFEKVSHSPGWPSYLLCERGWSWTPDPVTSTCPALGLQVCATIAGMASVWRIYFSISCRTRMVEICSLSFCLPEKIFITFSFLLKKKASLDTAFSIGRIFLPSLLCSSCAACSPLTCGVSAKKGVVVRIRYH